MFIARVAVELAIYGLVKGLEYIVQKYRIHSGIESGIVEL